MKGSIFTATFWIDATERAIKSAAQAAVLAVGGNDVVVNFWSLDGQQILAVVGSGALLSVLTSIISAPFSNPGTASVTNAVEAVTPTPGTKVE